MLKGGGEEGGLCGGREGLRLGRSTLTGMGRKGWCSCVGEGMGLRLGRSTLDMGEGRFGRCSCGGGDGEGREGGGDGAATESQHTRHGERGYWGWYRRRR